MSIELKGLIEEIRREKEIGLGVIVEALRSALLSAYKKHFGSSENVTIDISPDTGRLKVLAKKKVVKEIEDPGIEIEKEDAQRIKKGVKLNQEIEVEITPREFGRIAVQTAKQVVTQRIREAEREKIYQEFKEREGDIITGIVQRSEHKTAIITLGKIEAILPVREQIFGEDYRYGDRIKTYILSVRRMPKGPQIILSRTHPGLVRRLFELEIPEVYEKIVEIKNIAREAGGRTKIAVFSKDTNVDPVGSCVGVRGARVNSIIQELRGEKIDIIPYNEDSVAFVSSALKPAPVQEVIVHKEEGGMEVIVPKDKLSLAIGRKGQNVRLAAKLTGWKIDLKSPEEKVLEAKTKIKLIELPGVGAKSAQVLEEAGFKNVVDIAQSKIEDLTKVKGIGKNTAEKILKAAKDLIGETVEKVSR
ncbi:transcription termination factor NusA [bacterium]|nr:transcription termination factor NusA [bacterium]